MERVVVDHGVRTELFAPDGQSCLVCHEGGRVAEMLYEIVYEMLPYPFLWGKGDETAAQNIPDGGFFGVAGYFYLVTW